jgi:hypothetical protein
MGGAAGGDVAEQVRDHALRKVVGLDLIGNGHLLQFRRKAPMATDHALDQSLMGEMIEAAVLAVALARGIDQGEVARLSLRMGCIAFALEVIGFERDCDLLGKTDTDKAAGGHRVAVANETHGFGRGDYLAFFRKPQIGQCRVLAQLEYSSSRSSQTSDFLPRFGGMIDRDDGDERQHDHIQRHRPCLGLSPPRGRATKPSAQGSTLLGHVPCVAQPWGKVHGDAL